MLFIRYLGAALSAAVIATSVAQATEDAELALCDSQIERLSEVLRAGGIEDLNARTRAEDELEEAFEAQEEEEADECLDALAEAFEALGMGPELDPGAVRAAARAAGLDSLSTVAIPEVPNLGEFIRPGAEAQAIQLGKALFWDMQVGSDGQSCASCHFHAGVDNRVKNQLNPATRGGDEAFGVNVTEAGLALGLEAPAFGGNYTVGEDDFPFFLLEDAEEKEFDERVVLRDTNDVFSSQGVFSARFAGIDENGLEMGMPEADGVMHVGGMNVRRVEPRHTPTTINAVFNFDNFWDGRARNEFNGVNAFGLLDPDAAILVHEDGRLIEEAVVIRNSSLASQAVAPPTSAEEMSFADRILPDVGKKLLRARPLALQNTHPEDSVLGPLARSGQPGLTAETYADMVRTAFQPRYWESEQKVTFGADGARTIHDAGALGPNEGYTQMEANFALLFGLAVQMYESLLISDETPFDAFMEGDDDALDDDQLLGLAIFINGHAAIEDDPLFEDPLFGDVPRGNCASCHAGPELTAAAFTTLDKEGTLIGFQGTLELDGGELELTDETAFIDIGFSNIGVRPTEEDLARGGTELERPLSPVRQRLASFDFAPELPPCGGDRGACPADAGGAPRVQVDGAFKIPGLRNVELTGPYFHNGGQATLEQVIEFYDRRSDFGDVNIANLDREMARILLEAEEEGEEEEEEETEVAEEALVRFLLALTDERVRDERAPFDHPQLLVPNGHPGDHVAASCVEDLRACDDHLEIAAVGARGRAAEGLAPLEPFLGIDQIEEDEE